MDGDDAISDTVKSSLNDYVRDVDVKSSWDNMQKQLKFCGIDTYMDWKKTTLNKNGTGNSVPDSCCKAGNATVECGSNQIPNHEHSYQTGCFKQFVDYIEDNAYIVDVAGAGLGVLQIILLIGSCCIATKDYCYA